jgi:hypothetical protein
LISVSGCSLSAGRAVSLAERYKCCSCVCKKILPKRASSSHALQEVFSGCWHAAPQEFRNLHSNQLVNEDSFKNGPKATIFLKKSQNKKLASRGNLSLWNQFINSIFNKNLN